MATPGAWIAGIGMMTAVGDCAAQTAASVRAGISRYRESSVYNRNFDPMTLALLPEEALPPLAEILEKVPGLTSRKLRMLRLATPAFKEATQPVLSGTPPPLFLAGAEPLADRPPPVDDAFLDHLHTQVGGAFDRGTSAVFSSGRAGGFQALAAGLSALERGAPFAVIGGVDTYLDLYLLGTLDLEGRVLAEGVMDGFCPGEGAGFLLLASEAAAGGQRPGLATFVHLPFLAVELGHRYSEEPYKGEGLANAVTGALPPLEGRPVRTVYGSLNGENFGAKEWGVSVLRNKAALAEGFHFEHPADCFGDTGAACGPLLLGLAAFGMSRGYRPGACLVWCSSERELRGATCLARRSS